MKRQFKRVSTVVISMMLLLGLAPAALSSPAATGPAGPSASLDQSSAVLGPFVSEPVAAVVWNGDLRDLPQLEEREGEPRELPRPGTPERLPNAASDGWIDPVAQTEAGAGQMPDPLIEFPGLSKSDAGGWIPPDTNGDVGPNHYVETVNIGLGVYDKATGAELVAISYNDLFDGTGTPCDDQNRGDVISLYDPMADRWMLSDFSLPTGGPYYECIAVSQSGDPVSGGWYFYAYQVNHSQGSWHDYPKWGIWPDAYYMSANMFDPSAGAMVWAFDRAAMLNGLPVTVVSFELGSSYWSLLPANLRGPLPPAGAPNYFATVDWPNIFRLWEFHVDWANPGLSTFTGPVNLTVADFGLISEIPQRSPGALLDSLGDRPMFLLQYRNFGSHEALWVNHTVGTGGVAGVRWYEIRDPGGAPTVYQQGTYQPPDGLYRWMASLAVDQDGNMAVGYSVSSETTEPGIRYAGRLYGEAWGLLPQGEAELYQGAGVQTGSNRWGDYSAMSVDPIDDCTFWYTNEYLDTDSSNWQTRIGSFRFPSCGQPKGWISGVVYDAYSAAPIAGAMVVAEGLTTTLTVMTGLDGTYWMPLVGDTYMLTAGPLEPGYPVPTVVTATVVAGVTTTLDIPLVPFPNLVEGPLTVDDSVPGGNGNGYPEPGESGLLLWEVISNTGYATATNVTAHLVALSSGVSVTVADAAYPDLGLAAAESNLTPFEFSIAPTLPCGARLDFLKVVTADQGTFTLTFSLYAKVRLPRTALFWDDMENGEGNWTTGGTYNNWQITEEQSHSPSHAWSDSPGGNYPDNANSWVQAPVFDLSGAAEVALDFWHRYDLETAWDFGYLEVSLDGGSTWVGLDDYTGLAGWGEESWALPMLDDQANATFRFRLDSDSYVNEDGWYIDDVELSHEPYFCAYPVEAPGVPTLLAPPDGTVTTTQSISLTWEAGAGPQPDGYNLELDGTVVTTTDPFSATWLAYGAHSWRVRAFNMVGHSDYTAAWTVTVLEAPGVPTLLWPPDGTVTATGDLTFTWQAGGGGAPDGYNLELDGTVVTTTQPLYAASLLGGPHDWRVRAFNLAGVSEYSDLWTLTVAYRVYLPLVTVRY